MANGCARCGGGFPAEPVMLGNLAFCSVYCRDQFVAVPSAMQADPAGAGITSTPVPGDTTPDAAADAEVAAEKEEEDDDGDEEEGKRKRRSHEDDGEEEDDDAKARRAREHDGDEDRDRSHN
jgi:hypothetical protein